MPDGPFQGSHLDKPSPTGSGSGVKHALRTALRRLGLRAVSPRAEIRSRLARGGLTAAEAWFQQRVEGRPQRAQRLSEAMFSELRHRHPEAAIRYAERALQSGSTALRSTQWAKIAGKLARLYARQGRLEEALALLDGVPAQGPDAQTIAQRLARSLAEAGRLSEAVALLRRFPSAEPGDGRLERWTAQLRLLEQGWPLPPRRLEPAYVPISGRVLYLLHFSLPYRSAGYAIRSHGLLTGLRAGGCDVIGVTRPGFPDPERDPVTEVIPDEERVGDAVYRRLPDTRLSYETTPLDQYIDRYIGQIDRLARDLRPAILHAASNFVHGVTANVVAARLGLPSVYELRGLWELTSLVSHPGRLDSELHRMWLRMETEAALGASAVVAITGALKAEMVARGVPEARIRVVPNAVDTSRFGARERDRDLAAQLGLERKLVIGYVGSITAYEGLDDLIDAAVKLKDRRGDDFRVLIVGDGSALPGLKQRAAELRLGELVLFAGRVPHDQVERYYSLIDIAPFPRKPLRVCELVSPLKPFEAMAMEKAIVVSSVAALAEIVTDEVTGLVHRKGDVEDLARVLDRLLDDAALRARLGRAAGAWVRRERDWRAICRLLADLYDELQAAPPRPSRRPHAS